MSTPAYVRARLESQVALIGTGDGHTFDVSAQAALASSDERVVRVIAPGRIGAVGPGSATITATLGSSSVSAVVHVIADDGTFIAVDGDGCGYDESRGMSRDGQIVLFDSDNSDLVADDTNGVIDVFVRDLATGEPERISAGPRGEQGSQGSCLSAMSGDGRFVAFTTRAPEVSGVRAAGEYLVLTDRATGAIELIASGADPRPAPLKAFNPFLSFDGRFIAYQADITARGVFSTRAYLRDRLKGTTTPAGIDVDGAILDDSVPIAMSSDARFVAFVSASINGDVAVFVRDVIGETTIRAVSSGYAGANLQGDGALSDDGNTLAFRYHPHDAEIPQLVVFDVAKQSLTAMSDFSIGGAVAASPDGRYIAFRGHLANPCESHAPALRYDRLTGTFARIDARPSDQFDEPCVSVFRRDFGQAALGDLDDDGVVGASDLALVLAAWGTNDAAADLDGDGAVGPADLGMLVGAWTR